MWRIHLVGHTRLAGWIYGGFASRGLLGAWCAGYAHPNVSGQEEWATSGALNVLISLATLSILPFRFPEDFFRFAGCSVHRKRHSSRHKREGTHWVQEILPCLRHALRCRRLKEPRDTVGGVTRKEVARLDRPESARFLDRDEWLARVLLKGCALSTSGVVSVSSDHTTVRSRVTYQTQLQLQLPSSLHLSHLRIDSAFPSTTSVSSWYRVEQFLPPPKHVPSEACGAEKRIDS